MEPRTGPSADPLTPDVVLRELSVPPGVGEVVALAVDADLALATVIDRQNGCAVSAEEFRWSDDEGWHLERFAARDDVVAVNGRRPDRAGGTVQLRLGDQVHEVSVSSGGWWAFVARTEGPAPDVGID